MAKKPKVSVDGVKRRLTKVPSTFISNNFTWTITGLPQDKIDKEMAEAGPKGVFRGFSDRVTLRVVYAKEQSKQDIPRTVLHEVLHSLMRVNTTSILEHELEEKVVVHLEERLTDLIKNNPKLIKYFQDNL